MADITYCKRNTKKIAGNNPKRVFVEMARQEDKKKRQNISSRRDMLISLYKSCKDEERDWVEEIKKYSEAELRRKNCFILHANGKMYVFRRKHIIR